MSGLVFLGPPGVGKGTQAKIVAARLGIPAISTGEIFRANIGQRTQLGIVAQAYMDRGELVPDEVTNPMVADRLAQPDVQEGFLLDGYPRNLEQAGILQGVLAEQGLSLCAAVAITAPDDVLTAHMMKRAQEEDRADDTPEVFQRRLRAYEQRTRPIVDFYAELGLLREVDGVGSIEEVSQRIMAELAAAGCDV